MTKLEEAERWLKDHIDEYPGSITASWSRAILDELARLRGEVGEFGEFGEVFVTADDDIDAIGTALHGDWLQTEALAAHSREVLGPDHGAHVFAVRLSATKVSK